MDTRRLIFDATIGGVVLLVMYAVPVQAVSLTDAMLSKQAIVDNQVKKIQVSGYAKVDFMTAKNDATSRVSKNHLTIVGRCDRRCQVEYWQRGDTLHIWNNSYCKNSHWQVTVPGIRQICVGSHGYVYTKESQIDTPLDLEISDWGRVDLQGKLALNRIYHRSLGGVRLRGINSHGLELIGKSGGRVTLSGKVDNFTARLSNHAVVDASNLAVKNLYAVLKDWARLWARVSGTLFVQAEGDSKLFYRPYPRCRVVELRERALVGYQTKECTPDSFTDCEKIKIGSN